MNDVNLRSDHLGRYQARLKRLDELLARARQKQIESVEHKAELNKLAERREELATHLEKIEQIPAEDWQEEEIEQAGPMGVWDAVAQQLEKLVEKLEKK
ncbi:hypothetical protein [Thiohalophilus sp.]|uniref:hypothetical protein n=1 Tax=Thiohalophilus sp. TaxID=3028392 RepID=UPI003974A4F2